MCFLVRLSVSQEPHCFSFTFLEQLLEKLVRIESRVGALETQSKSSPEEPGNIVCVSFSSRMFLIRFRTCFH